MISGIGQYKFIEFIQFGSFGYTPDRRFRQWYYRGSGCIDDSRFIDSILIINIRRINKHYHKQCIIRIRYGHQLYLRNREQIRIHCFGGDFIEDHCRYRANTQQMFRRHRWQHIREYIL